MFIMKRINKIYLSQKSQNCKNINRFFIYWVYFSFSIILITVSGFRLLGQSRDDLNYLSKEEFLEDFSVLTIKIQEPTYWLILSFSKYILGDISFQFLIYAVIHIGILFFVIKRYSINVGISLLTYLFFFFLLHGYTQIRMSVAISIFLFTIHYMFFEKRFKYLYGILVSTLFHYSSLLYLYFLYLKGRKINRYFYFFLPFLGVLIGIVLTKVDLDRFFNELYFPEFISYKLMRSLDNDVTSSPNPLNMFVMLKLLIYWTSLLKINYMVKISKYSIIYIKILGWSIFVFYSLISAPVLAFRISEMMSSVLILLMPVFIKIFKDEIIIKILFIILGIFFIIKSYYYLMMYQG